MRHYILSTVKTTASVSLSKPTYSCQYPAGLFPLHSFLCFFDWLIGRSWWNIIDPFLQFRDWFSLAVDAKISQPEATTLSTAQLPSGRVSARMVYLKELDHRGFVIYSNWDTSHKARDIQTNPQASLTFWFKELERQVRVEGIAERLTAEESQVYYDTR